MTWEDDGWDVDEDGRWGYSTPGTPRPPRRDPAVPRRNAVHPSTPNPKEES